MTVDLRHYDPSSENKDPGPPPPKGRPLWPIMVGFLLMAVLYFGAQPSDEVANDPLDSNGAEGITFTRDKQNHYFRENNEVGNILIITGMVRNSYSDRRSFIRLRGHLLTDNGRTLADRYVYAGNIVSEQDLQDLPIKEVYSRLSLKGGRDGLNVNVEPGREIPFMLVFDKLPEGMAEYRIDPVGSSPSDPGALSPGETWPEAVSQPVVLGLETADLKQTDKEALRELFLDIISDDKSEDHLDPAGSSPGDEGLKP